MISATTGEVAFESGLRICPHQELDEAHIQRARSYVPLPVPGWGQHHLGLYPSPYGPFEVDIITDGAFRIQAVFLAHADDAYRANVANDGGRHRFHEGILATDLLGKREFPWGEAFCQTDGISRKDWLVLTYAADADLPLRPAIAPHELHEHEPEAFEVPLL